MKTSDKGISFIKAHEILKLKAYKCPAKVWTIGWGHTSGVNEGDVITKEVAELYLRGDLKDAEMVLNLQRLKLLQRQFDSLVSLIFNIGVGNFLSSTLLVKLKENPNSPEIAEQMIRWTRAKKKFLRGLLARRLNEIEIYYGLK